MEDIDWQSHIGRTDSPIEAMFLKAFCDLAMQEGFGVARMSSEPAFVIEIQPQRWIGNYRVDFMITYRYFGPILQFVVECDGHEFHERTKVQAQRDKSRDRAIQATGPKVYRFTGSEIHACAEVCAREMLDLIINFQTGTSDALYRSAVKETRARRKAKVA